jgi:hypothetical protein
VVLIESIKRFGTDVGFEEFAFQVWFNRELVPPVKLLALEFEIFVLVGATQIDVHVFIKTEQGSWIQT